MTNNNILDRIAQARNRSEYLALASSETLDLVAGAKSAAPIDVASSVAQSLFCASRIVIKSKGQPGSRMVNRTYDLRDANQAYDALETWGVRSRSNGAWMMCGLDRDAYYQMAIADKEQNISRHVTSFLQLVRKN